MQRRRELFCQTSPHTPLQCTVQRRRGRRRRELFCQCRLDCRHHLPNVPSALSSQPLSSSKKKESQNILSLKYFQLPHLAKVPLSIIFNILETAAFQKNRTVPCFISLDMVVPDPSQSRAKLFSYLYLSVFAFPVFEYLGIISN